MTSPANHCDNCGLCCMSLVIEIGEHDVIREPRLIPHVKLLDGGGEYVFEDPLDREYILLPTICPFLDQDCKCSIYPTRPNVCVGFMVGGEQCNQLRLNAGLPAINMEAAR